MKRVQHARLLHINRTLNTGVSASNSSIQQGKFNMFPVNWSHVSALLSYSGRILTGTLNVVKRSGVLRLNKQL